jgi:hypothetical protein
MLRALFPLTIATILLGAVPAHADGTEQPWRLSLDSDPSTFLFSGFSGWAMAKPAGTTHLRGGIGGFGLDSRRSSCRT